MMIILFFTLSTAFSAPPDHQVPKQDLRNKITGKSVPAPQLEHAALLASSDVRFKTATEKTNDTSRSGSIIRAGNLHPYRPPSDHADDPFGPFSDHDVQDLLQLNNLLGADVTQPNPLLLDKDILMSPLIPNPSTLLSSPRPPDPHL